MTILRRIGLTVAVLLLAAWTVFMIAVKLNHWWAQ